MYKAKPPDKEHDRFAIFVRVCHERFEANPVQFMMSGHDRCDCSEEPFRRKYKIKAEASGLILPFVPHRVVAQNTTGLVYSKQPSEGVLAADSLKSILISFDGGETWPSLISPRMITVLELVDWSLLRLKSPHGETEIDIAAFA